MTAERYALVTGGYVGIGFELAKLLAADGYNLVLVARNEDRLKKAALELETDCKIQTKVIALDLSKAEAPKILYDQLKSTDIPIEILINNAGFNVYGEFAQVKREALLNMAAVNMIALTDLTHLFLKDMLARKSGRILNIASTAGIVPGPRSAVYFATKSYVISLGQALANELRGSGVTATVLCPGPTKTEFFTRSDSDHTRLEHIFPMSAERVARIGYRAMMAGRPHVIAGIFNKVEMFFIRFMPRMLVAKVAKWQLGKPGK